MCYAFDGFAVRRGQRKRRAGESRVPWRKSARSGAGPSDPSRRAKACKWNSSPHRPAGPTASSSGFTLRTSPARWTIAASTCRKALGEELARLETLTIDDDTIVVPVPDTSKAAADAMAFQLGVPSIEGLIRNRYYRPHVSSKAATRRQAKAAPNIHAAAARCWKAKRCCWWRIRSSAPPPCGCSSDDPRDVGRAREIHVRVACPPIVAPCFLRHRHVDHRRTVRATVSARCRQQPVQRRGVCRNGLATRRRSGATPAGRTYETVRPAT